MREYGERTQEWRDSITKLLCDELEEGHSVRVACDLVGISEAAVYRWKLRAEQGDDEAIVLVRRLKNARARGLKEYRNQIKLAADAGDWRAAAWLTDKQYPGWLGEGAVQELVVLDPEQIEEANEEARRKEEAWSTPERVRELILTYVELGIVTIEELTGIAPRPASTAAPAVQQQPKQLDRVVALMPVVVFALADGPRDLQELTDSICRALGCTQEQVHEACNRLGVEVLDAGSPGRKPRLQLPQQPRISRTNETAVETPDEPSIRGESSGSPAENQPSERGNWVDGPAWGTGNFSASKRRG